MLLGGLDAFGDDGHAEAVGQLDDREDDGVARRVAFEVGDEALVDLHDVDREPLEVGERGVARFRSRRARASRRCRFSSSSTTSARWLSWTKTLSVTSRVTSCGIGAGVGEHLGDGRREVGRHELLGGDVDRHREVVGLRRRCQRWRSGQARSRTHRPISMMRPDCSAMRHEHGRHHQTLGRDGPSARALRRR